MEPTFDPVRKRRFWLDFNLEFETEFVPDAFPPQAQPLYLSTTTNSLINGYLLGLVDRVQPTLEAIVEWMERQPEPDVLLFDEAWRHWRDGWYALYLWRRTLGLCKWLCSIDGAEQHFAAALRAEWQAWHQAPPGDSTRDFPLRRQSLTEHLAMALAANDPYAGLQFRAAAGIERISADHPSLLFLGQWACLHLHCGGERDRSFVDYGNRFLGALWRQYILEGRLSEPALWLKVFYWDSSAARTPEQTIAKAYDFVASMKDTIDGGQVQSAPQRRRAAESLEELEYDWIRSRWRMDGAMEEGRMARDARHKRQVNRGNFSLGSLPDAASGPRREVTNGVLSRSPKAL